MFTSRPLRWELHLPAAADIIEGILKVSEHEG